MEIIIKAEDITEHSDYTDPENCPLAIELKKALGRISISVVLSHVRTENKGEVIGTVSPWFMWNDFCALRDGFTKQFVTYYTPDTQKYRPR